MNTQILTMDTTTEESSFIRLEQEPAKFSFNLQSGDDSKVSGYVDLTPEEYEVFNNAFKRMVASLGEPTETIGDKKVWKGSQ